ncbi:MDR family NADP-dependent oxidoreductase [Actinoplanes sp. G11-F43]|uniref:MDR family NADP-dependent oxidoreductase n=1 Tax=Actinoplanes sp. G11-F43 TaxID=3424130 RepID=UPI003D331A7C
MREIRVAALPHGLPRADDLAVAEVPIPVAGAGEVLVRNRYFTVFAALRTLLAGMSGPRAGDTLFGPALGEVVSAPSDSGLRAGDLVEHLLGWREYAVVPVGSCLPLDERLPDPLVHLAQGATAYGALTRAVQVRPGETVFVSGGAGSLGSIAGQVARLLGAGRVVGSTGSPWKAERMLTEFGYDEVVPRGSAPEQVDVLFDTVGGDDLRAAIAAARPGARFALVGALSGQLSASGPGTTAPVEIDSFALVLKQIAVTGYSSMGDHAVRGEWLTRIAGRIHFPHERIGGIAAAPQAMQDVLAGRYAGTVIIEV